MEYNARNILAYLKFARTHEGRRYITRTARARGLRPGSVRTDLLVFGALKSSELSKVVVTGEELKHMREVCACL